MKKKLISLAFIAALGLGTAVAQTPAKNEGSKETKKECCKTEKKECKESKKECKDAKKECKKSCK